MLLLRAAHPQPALVVTLVTAGLAVGLGAPARTLLVLVIATALGQVSVGWSNDWLDAARGNDLGRADKPVAAGAVPLPRVRAAALVAAALTIPASLLLGVVPGLLHVAAVALAWAYNLRLKSSVWSIVSYLLAFGSLPVVVSLAAGRGVPHLWAILAAASFGGGVHLANALPDLERDVSQGIMGVPQRLGPTRTLVAAVVLLAAGASAALVSPAWTGSAAGSGIGAVRIGGLALVGVTLAGVLVAGLGGRLTLAFRLTMLLGLGVVGLLVAQGGQIAG